VKKSLVCAVVGVIICVTRGGIMSFRTILTTAVLVLTISACATVPSVTRDCQLEPVFFEYDQSSLTVEASRTLDRNVVCILVHPDGMVEISGHTDERGTEEYNVSLGLRLAKSAERYLMKTSGIPKERMVTVSYGEDRPLCTASEESCWVKNRRVELRFLVEGLE
jgi:peptidoglycan-associated lipoprotein